MATGDEQNDDLESLFDSIREKNTPQEAASDKAIVTAASDEDKAATPLSMISQLGKMTRTLHDTMRELGLNKEIEKVASSIPDARDRLNYVATLTQKAAERVLNATEAAQPLVQSMEAAAQQLDAQWQQMLAGKLSNDEFKALVLQNKMFLQNLPAQFKMTNGYLMEIMMAQDFQDLTGQVIKKIVDLTQSMEKQLLALLLENAPTSYKADTGSERLNGPVINPKVGNVVTSQDEVDDLLGSLGF